jgi:ribosomal protein L37AE/L43A
MNDSNDKKKCPVCGFLTMPNEECSFYICDICGWEDDGLQEDDPDFEGGANKLSLNQFRAQWLKGHHRED